MLNERRRRRAPWQRTPLVPRSNPADAHFPWQRQELPPGRFRKNRRRNGTTREGSRLQDGKNGRELAQQADSPVLPRRAFQDGVPIERFGFLWLFAIGAVWLVRLLLDPTMVRRPLLEPNLTTGGLIFIGASLFVFLMANVWTSQRFQPVRALAQTKVESIAADETPREAAGSAGEGVRRGPGYALLNLVPSIPTMPLMPEGMPTTSQQRTYAIVAKVIAVLCHLAVVLGIVAIGYWHFGNTKTGAVWLRCT